MATGIEKDYQKGDIICHQGDSGQYIYILQSGKLGIYKDENLVSEYTQVGTILGEMSIILGDERSATIKAMEDSKADIGWGSQIRSYVLDASRIKDLRTNYETGNTQAVLDGDLDKFIEASLKQGL